MLKEDKTSLILLLIKEKSMDQQVQFSKVKALQQVIIKAIHESPHHLRQWGAVFLSGLTE
ncbi:MAG: hypothetical protein QRY72_02940 [Candidatus Rhabdochlamydia sp.]